MYKMWPSQIVLFFYWAKMTANWLVVYRVRVVGWYFIQKTYWLYRGQCKHCELSESVVLSLSTSTCSPSFLVKLQIKEKFWGIWTKTINKQIIWLNLKSDILGLSSIRHFLFIFLKTVPFMSLLWDHIPTLLR